MTRYMVIAAVLTGCAEPQSTGSPHNLFRGPFCHPVYSACVTNDLGQLWCFGENSPLGRAWTDALLRDAGVDNG